MATKPVEGRFIIVTGSRHLKLFERVWHVLDLHNPARVIEGGGPGADHAARLWLAQRGIPTRSYIADWKRYGDAAGPIRNRRMLLECPHALVVAFPEPGCTGTRDCVDQAEKFNMEIEIYGRFE